MKHSTTVRIDELLLRAVVFELIEEAKQQIARGQSVGCLLDVARRLLAAEKVVESGTVGTEAAEAA